MKNRKSQVKDVMNDLIAVTSELDKISDQELTPENRIKLRQILFDAKAKGLTRKDENQIIKLYLGSEEIAEITGYNNKIFASTDRLWGTICGYNERVQEIEAYERGNY